MVPELAQIDLSTLTWIAAASKQFYRKTGVAAGILARIAPLVRPPRYRLDPTPV
jgi:hypothetical protein